MFVVPQPVLLRYSPNCFELLILLCWAYRCAPSHLPEGNLLNHVFSRTISKGGWRLGVIVDGASATVHCSALYPHDYPLVVIIIDTC